MDAESANPFDSLESSYEYVCLLHEALEAARVTIDEDLAQAATEQAGRRVEALQLVKYKLGQLDEHLRGSRRILNDMRMLRRIIVDRNHPSSDRVPTERLRT